MNIVLICNAGMSTSVLVQKMQQEAVTRNMDATIAAYSVEALDEILSAKKVDCILVGPQIRYMLNNIKKKVNGECPVDVIDMKDYGRINGAGVLDQAIELLK